ncbi:hypothetical protein [Vibrio furnissii]|uniref:hypothetical protein n=1 Tax=Vibrio furnissii TaxID=29494 RepID=UPI001EECEA87|nr:hypothetical protein [Vibrio furnissii]MCG6231516.1 hypothetical protein [Vibrio furnissii]MCG6261441.1 hypothetical protein [Vibrio furnissii]
MNNFDELKAEYTKQLHNLGINDTRGYTFDQYFKCMNEPEPPQNTKQLQARVGGEFRRVKIAFEILEKTASHSVITREIPIWFDEVLSTLLSHIQETFKSSWNEFDKEIQSIASVQTDLLEAQLNKDKKDINEYLSVIDELEDELYRKESEIKKLNDDINNCHELHLDNIKLNAILEQYKDRHSEQSDVIKEKEQEIKSLNVRLIDMSMKNNKESSVVLELNNPDETFDDEDIYPENIGDVFND